MSKISGVSNRTGEEGTERSVSLNPGSLERKEIITERFVKSASIIAIFSAAFFGFGIYFGFWYFLQMNSFSALILSVLGGMAAFFVLGMLIELILSLGLTHKK